MRAECVVASWLLIESIFLGTTVVRSRRGSNCSYHMPEPFRTCVDDKRVLAFCRFSKLALTPSSQETLQTLGVLDAVSTIDNEIINRIACLDGHALGQQLCPTGA